MNKTNNTSHNQSENNRINNIVIVGGGTAGWITAGRIAAEYVNLTDSELTVTLIESPDIPTVGVGEGTWPTMRSTLIKLGIRETEFIQACDATFKQGAKFCGWKTGKANDFYYHPLMLPHGFSKTDLAQHWHNQHPITGQSFSEAVCIQEAICEKGLAPKTIRAPEYTGAVNYAYHLNAGKFSTFLQQHCTEKLGVQHVLANVTEVNTKLGTQDIESVVTDRAGIVTGDLFVDCSGFNSLLLAKHYQIDFNDCSDTLFIDSALAVQVPYPSDDSPIASHTLSTAQDAGWIWDIGLSHRRGVGHVYSSQHTTEPQAISALAHYTGIAEDKLDLKKIPIRCGHRKQFWVNNCVAVGLSAGFLEPLEASALVLVELSAQMIAEQLPANRHTMDIVAKRFNTTFTYRWERIIDFLKLHYCISQRTDSAFWRDNCDTATIPDSLLELLELWQHRAPSDLDFTSNNEVFPAASYQFVLYGMGFNTQFERSSRYQSDIAKELIMQKNLHEAEAIKALPPNRDLINKIKQFGLQTI